MKHYNNCLNILTIIFKNCWNTNDQILKLILDRRECTYNSTVCIDNNIVTIMWPSIVVPDTVRGGQYNKSNVTDRREMFCTLF